MPSHTRHEEQAKRFETFLQSLDKSISVNREWIVIGASYAALHWLEAYFDHQHGLHFAEHVPRNNAVWRLGLTIATEYMRLYRAGRNARYDMRRFTPQEVDNLLREYETVKNFVTEVLHPPTP